MDIVGIIPSRYHSSRFPGKPLADILGFPMIWWVYQQAKKVKELNKGVYVATDDIRIEEVCKQYDIPVIMTDKKHTNGSERLCEVAGKLVSDIYVTIQGDEPLLEPKTISEVLRVLAIDNKIGCATLKIAYKNPIDVINKTTPKVVTDLDDNILLFTRAAVPYPKANLNYIIYKPIGVYAFRRETLLKYNNLQKGPLEKAEDIELLRFIENGIKVKIGLTESETVAVDTPKDLNRVIEILKNKREESL